jgi:hypothetical protein
MLRFARDAARDFLFGIAAHFRLDEQMATQPCDILLLQSSPKVILLKRKIQLIEALRARGYALEETSLDEMEAILRGRRLASPAQYVPMRYFGYAAHAAWLVNRYHPRILLNDRNGSLYSSFLRLELQRKNGVLVHLAHACTIEASRRLDMNDYDYYFLFGQSSLDALAQKPLLFGQSLAVLSGSHMIDRSFALPAPQSSDRTVLVLGVGPDKEKEADYQATYAMLRDWAKLHAGYRLLIKAHPRSLVPFWQQVAAELDNVEILPKNCSLVEALSRASVVVNIMSNAVIEAALAGRPILFVNAGDQLDVFEQERFFGQRIKTIEELDRSIATLDHAYSEAIEVAKEFATHHLDHGADGLDNVINLLEQIFVSGYCPAQPLHEQGMQ